MPENSFSDMTLESAKADAFWNAITIKKLDDGELQITMKIVSEIHLPPPVLADVDASNFSAELARMIFEHMELDIQELEMILKHKIADTVKK